MKILDTLGLRNDFGAGGGLQRGDGRVNLRSGQSAARLQLEFGVMLGLSRTLGAFRDRGPDKPAASHLVTFSSKSQ